jgi:hypothetical protein
VPRPTILLFAATAVASSAAGAQQTSPGAPDILRGRVTDDSSHGLITTVMVTRGPDRLTQQARTDSAGNYRVRFDPGTGDYLVYASAPGFKAARRRVQRNANEHEFVVNFTLARDLAMLAAVTVTADKPERASNDVSPYQLETGASERWRDGVNGQIPPSLAGDLNAIAGTMSNVTMTAAGPSVLGSGAESNLTTLNGMGLAAGALPRAARTETRVTTATFDPTRGGFAGANVDVRLEPGDRFYQQRTGFLTFDPPAWQFTDATGHALGATSGGARGSFGADGELIREALTYNVALDVGRSSSTPATLLDASADALERAGIAPDSVARVLALAAPLGIPLSGGRVPGSRQHDAVTWLGRLDDTRDSLQTRALTSYAGYTRDGAVGVGPLAAPAASGERRERTLGAMLTLGAYVGEGQRILTETRFAASQVHAVVDPYRALPEASVLVRSASAENGSDVAALTLGGGSNLPSDDTRWTLEGANETSWNMGGKRHRFRALVWARADGLRQEGSANGLGAFTFNSIADLESGHPASFTRTLAQPERSGAVWNAAAALAHMYAPSRYFSVLYGARVEGDGFASAPPSNPALEQALGVSTGAAPSRLHISPRLGFSYMYNRDKANGSGMSRSSIGQFYRTSTGVIRGGIGEFRDLLRPGILADASAATGLPDGTSVLSCVGAAVPAVDWSRFGASEAAIPTQCLDGSGVLADRAPAVSLIDPSYDVPHSWRASLDWSTNISSWLLKVGGLASYDLAQPGTIDANFSGLQRLTLAGEGNRPVYVTAASIDPASGAVSSVESRRSSLFGRVADRVSDLRGYGSQLTVSLSPDVFKYRGRGSMFVSTSYTLQQVRRQFRGFDGGGFGDPREVEWAPSANDARHIVVLSGGFSTPKTGTITMFARAQSGLPFTPVVQGDVNGDGRGGDRAFIPNPATIETTDPALAAQLRALLADGSASARQCVERYLGNVPARNGCRGPWTQSLNVQWRPPTPARWDGRVSPNIYLWNVLSGVDQLVHGSGGMRGWGSPALPDPVLLVPRAFDASASRFRYDVNPRFADTRPGRTLLREPFRIVLDISLRLSTDYDLQQLRRAVEPVRSSRGWERRSADSLTAFYLSNTSNIHKLLLQESDSLFLSPVQVAALRRADSLYSARVRDIYRPLGEFLARAQGGASRAELDSVQTVQKVYWKIFWEQPEIADSIVTPTQRELMPTLKGLLSTPMTDREHSRWQFGHPVTIADKPRETR